MGITYQGLSQLPRFVHFTERQETSGQRPEDKRKALFLVSVFSPFDAHAFLGDEDLVADAEAVGFGEQAAERFIVRFVA